MKDQILQFGKLRSLVGVLSEPDKPTNLPAIIFLNAGLIHRIGPNRIYVKVARHLATLGFPVLRFDLSGIGDSQPRMDNLPFEKSFVDDTQQAMDVLAQTRNIQHFILMGHCAGAVGSFLTAMQDSRVMGVVLMNPEGGEDWSDYDQKRKVSQYYQNYYGKKALLDSQRWKRLLTGQVAYGSIARNLFQNILWNKISTVIFRVKSRASAAADPAHDATVKAIQELVSQGTYILFVYSEGSTGYERLRVMLGKDSSSLNASGKLQLRVVPASDHTFTLKASQEYLVGLLADWLKATTLNPFPVRQFTVGASAHTVP